MTQSRQNLKNTRPVVGDLLAYTMLGVTLGIGTAAIDDGDALSLKQRFVIAFGIPHSTSAVAKTVTGGDAESQAVSLAAETPVDDGAARALR